MQPEQNDNRKFDYFPYSVTLIQVYLILMKISLFNFDENKVSWKYGFNKTQNQIKCNKS